MSQALFDAITTDNDATEPLEKLLEGLKGSPDLEARNAAGHTPLEHAVAIKAAKSAEALLDAGAQPIVARAVIDKLYAARAEGEYAPLDEAIYYGCRRLARCLLENGAPPDAPGVGGMHALHLAAMHNDTELVGMLLDRGVAVDLPMDMRPDTALHLATDYRRAETVALLVARGANLTAKNEHGKTAQDLARRDAKLLAALAAKLGPPARDRSDDSRALIAGYLGRKVTADLDGSLFAHRAAIFHFFFEDPKKLRSFLREEYNDETNGWNWAEVVPVASVSWCDDKSKSFSWIFLDWRDGKTTPEVVVTTTDRWDDEPRVDSLDELELTLA